MFPRKNQVSVVFRLVDGSNCIREDFFDFISTQRVTGEALYCKNGKSTLSKYGLK